MDGRSWRSQTKKRYDWRERQRLLRLMKRERRRVRTRPAHAGLQPSCCCLGSPQMWSAAPSSTAAPVWHAHAPASITAPPSAASRYHSSPTRCLPRCPDYRVALAAASHPPAPSPRSHTCLSIVHTPLAALPPFSRLRLPSPSPACTVPSTAVVCLPACLCVPSSSRARC